MLLLQAAKNKPHSPQRPYEGTVISYVIRFR